MNTGEINPFVRFAEKINYQSENRRVCARDSRLFYIIHGTAQVFVNDKKLTLKENSLLYLRAGIDYEISAENKIELIVLNFELTNNNSSMENCMPPILAERFSEDMILDSEDVSDNELLNRYIFFDDALPLYYDLKNVVAEFEEKSLYFSEKCSGILKQIIFDLLRYEAAEHKKSSDAVMTAIRYIKENYFRQISNSEISKLTGYHSYHLNRMFIKQTDMSMHSYILKMRMNEAKRLIINTDLPVRIIGEKVGFTSSTYFSNYFKKEFFMTPSMYRKTFKNNI